MSTEDDCDLANILIDNELPSDSSLTLDILDETKPSIKRIKASLKCVVCGDNAFGIIELELTSK